MYGNTIFADCPLCVNLILQALSLPRVHFTLKLSSPQIFLSHDWPQSIEHYGDLGSLLRRKTFFRQDIETGQLGSPPLMGLLQTIQPEWWFSAHLHVRYEATVYHDGRPPSGSVQLPASVQNPDEIAIDDEDVAEGGFMETESTMKPTSTNERLRETSTPARTTKFLALDKCLPRRDFLEVHFIPHPPSSHTEIVLGRGRTYSRRFCTDQR